MLAYVLQIIRVKCTTAMAVNEFGIKSGAIEVFVISCSDSATDLCSSGDN